jgi:hypothetical protein
MATLLGNSFMLHLPALAPGIDAKLSVSMLKKYLTRFNQSTNQPTN